MQKKLLVVFFFAMCFAFGHCQHTCGPVEQCCCTPEDLEFKCPYGYYIDTSCPNDITRYCPKCFKGPGEPCQPPLTLCRMQCVGQLRCCLSTNICQIDCAVEYPYLTDTEDDEA